MSKELEFIETITTTQELKPYLEQVKKELKRLEAIDNAKPSEALERTSSEFIDGYPTGNVNVGMTWEEHSAIKQALIKTQKQEEDIIHYKGTIANLRRDNALLKELNAEKKKVLDIIFNKPLKSATTINYLKINQIFPDMLDYEHYCLTVKEKIRNTEEEFEALKRWVKNV